MIYSHRFQFLFSDSNQDISRFKQQQYNQNNTNHYKRKKKSSQDTNKKDVKANKNFNYKAKNINRIELVTVQPKRNATERQGRQLPDEPPERPPLGTRRRLFLPPPRTFLMKTRKVL